MKILFVCEDNLLKSKIAEALFKKYAGPMHQTKSAAFNDNNVPQCVSDSVKLVLNEYGIRDISEIPIQISSSLVKWADKIVVLTRGVNNSSFDKEKTDIWEMDYYENAQVKDVRKIVTDINDRVRLFLGSISKSRP